MKITEKDIANLQRENQILKAQHEKDKAYIDYLAMMCDVELEEDDA